MNCWDILGIEPTRDSSRIREAFERQNKFAEGEESQRLHQAYRQAMAEAGVDIGPTEGHAEPEPDTRQAPEHAGTQSQGGHAELSSTDRQVVREVVIQVNAMLNDTGRLNDVAIWRAILTEPPADRDPVRSAIGEQLEPTLRPLAEEARLSAPVARFLGDWFGWYGMTDALEREAREDELTLDDAGRYQGVQFPDNEGAEGSDSNQQRPGMTNFWPAVIGWVVGIIILTSLFGALTGGGG